LRTVRAAFSSIFENGKRDPGAGILDFLLAAAAAILREA